MLLAVCYKEIKEQAKEILKLTPCLGSFFKVLDNDYFLSLINPHTLVIILKNYFIPFSHFTFPSDFFKFAFLLFQRAIKLLFCTRVIK
jgi:hypothetical protein